VRAEHPRRDSGSELLVQLGGLVPDGLDREPEPVQLVGAGHGERVRSPSLGAEVDVDVLARCQPDRGALRGEGDDQQVFGGPLDLIDGVGELGQEMAHEQFAVEVGRHPECADRQIADLENG
jgi:hypothetical protein